MTLLGMHAPYTAGKRRVRADEIKALEALAPRSIAIFDDHLRDDTFRAFLQHEADNGVEIYCRLMPVSVPDPSTTALEVTDLAGSHPWVRGWIPCSDLNAKGLNWEDV